MNLTMAPEIETLLTDLVRSGRCASPEEAVADGLRLVELRDAAAAALRKRLSYAVGEADRDGWLTEEDLDRELAVWSSQAGVKRA